MEVVIKGRHLEITDALRSHIEHKISKIERYINKITEVDIILSVEKYRHMAEITFIAKGIKLNGKEITNDMYSSIDKVMDKIEKQVKKRKEIVTNHKSQMGLKEVILALHKQKMIS